MPCCNSTARCPAGMLVAPCCAGQPAQAADPSQALETGITKPARDGGGSLPCESPHAAAPRIAVLVRVSRAAHEPGSVDHVPLYILNAAILR